MACKCRSAASLYLLHRGWLNNFAADSAVYCQIKRVQVELYTKLKDPQAEEEVEKALSSFFWKKTETYLSTESVFRSCMKSRCKNA